MTTGEHEGERTRDRVSLDWAATQNDLGSALLELGSGRAAQVVWKEAVTAYREARKEYTQKRVPLDWAMNPKPRTPSGTRMTPRKCG
jgi:hypothetical protein